MYDSIKLILKIPKTIPIQALFMETGLLDPQTTNKKYRTSMEMIIEMIPIKQ